MTQQEFFAHTQLYPNQVNIWYSDQGAPFTLYAITVPIFDITSPTPVDNTAQLEALQQLSIPLSTGNILIANITSRNRVQTPGTPTVPVTVYYYFTITPITVQSFGNAAIQLNQLIFSPAINIGEYNASPYNVTKGNIQQSKPSQDLMVADRYQIGTLANPTYTGPLNIEQLLSGSAIKSTVQDTNYTSTAWVNGRYAGSKTTINEYGTEPAISGRVFQGSEFPAANTPGEIRYAISTQQAIYKDYFYAGGGDTPGFDTTTTYYQITSVQVLNNSNLTQLIIELTPGAIYTVPPKTGDLLRVESQTEVFRVESVGTVTGIANAYVVYVTRGWNGVTQTIFPPVNLEKLLLVQVYNIEQDKLSGVPKGQVYVKETGQSLALDSSGYVLSASQVSTIL